MLRVTADELVTRLQMPDGGDPFDGEPLVVVDGGSSLPSAVNERLAGVPAVVVAVDGGLAGVADVVADDADVLARIEAAVGAHPEAAVALAVLLRGTLARSISEGLAAESATYSMLQGGADHRRWLAARPVRERGDDGSAPPVQVERAGDELRIVLDRPAVRNAFNAAMRDAIVDALAVAAADPAVQVVVTANGPSFCSGGDLDEFGTASDPAAAHVIRLRRSAGRSIAEVADRVSVRVHGACVGAGVELPAFAGQVVAAADASFRLPEVAMGLVPGAGGTVSIPRRIGRHRSALLALTGQTIDAATALAWGLVDELVD